MIHLNTLKWNFGVLPWSWVILMVKCVPCEKSDDCDNVSTVSKETEYFNSVMKTVQSFTERKDYKCEECDFEARFSEDLKMHLQEKHQIRCQDCHEHIMAEQN